MSIGTGGADWTEAGQPVDAKNSPDVTVATVGAVTAEASVVPGTVAHLGFRINMEEWTLFVVTGVEPGVEVALRHLTHVVFVKELALVSLLTQPPEPVLADDGFVSPHVSEGTGGSSLTSGANIELAHRRTALVHPREGERLGSQLLGQGHLCDNRSINSPTNLKSKHLPQSRR